MDDEIGTTMSAMPVMRMNCLKLPGSDLAGP